MDFLCYDADSNSFAYMTLGSAEHEIMAVPEGQKSASERRGARRVTTLRQTLFEKMGGGASLYEGKVVNLSRDGLQVRTRMPAAVGDLLFLDIDPRPDEPSSTRIQVEGRVVWACPDRGQGGAMGIQIRRRGADLSALATPPNLQALSGLMRATSWPSPARPERNRLPRDVARPVRIRKVEEEEPAGKKRKVAGLLLGLLCALFLLLLLGWSHTRQEGPFRGRLGPSAEGGEEEEAVAREPDYVPPLVHEAGPMESVTPFDVRARGLPDRKTIARNHGGAVTASLTRDPPGTVSHDRQGRVFARLEGTPSNEMTGTRRDAAPAFVSGGMMREETERELDANPLVMPDGARLAANARPPLRTAAGYLQQRMRPLDARIPEEGVAIVVDKTAFSLVLFKDGQPVRRFPVGLGRNDSTPEGAFIIANKIRDPDWYNRGRVVEAGDPENPLGASWMGLGRDKPTSYGIHPTEEAESIGREASRGCIRMHPDNAETVFRFCPVGAPVFICE